MNINSPKNDWAEQDPNIWWKHTCKAIKRVCSESSVDSKKIISIGISYQMHGLVVVGWKVWRRVKWASHNWTPETQFDYMLKHTRVIKPGMDQDVKHFLGRLQRVYEKHNFTGVVGVFRVMSGGNTNEYIICEGFNKYGELGEYPDTEKTEEELYNEMFGWESYRKDAKAYNLALEMYSRTTERQHFNEKLSTQL